MTAEELTSGALKARTSFYSYPSIFRRLFDFSANFGSFYNLTTFLICNLISRQDILRKQGLVLGEARRSEEQEEPLKNDLIKESCQ